MNARITTQAFFDPKTWTVTPEGNGISYLKIPINTLRAQSAEA